MARGGGGMGEKQGKVKFKYVEFELDGSDSTLQESLRNIAGAIMRGNPTPPKAHAQLAARSIDATAPVSASIEENPVVEGEGEDISAAMPTQRAPVRRPAPKSPTIVEDVDLSGAEKPLKAFAEQAHMNEDTVFSKRYLAIAYWFKTYASTPEVTMDHVFTAFRFLGWKTPPDAAQPLRDLKQKQQWMTKGDGKGAYKINHIGEDVVLEMLKGNG